MKTERYLYDAHAEWDALVDDSCNATFLHSRRFLSYHGARFEDVSLMIRDDDGRLVGVLPAAIDPTDGTQVVSHPGITYGGIVHGRRLKGSGVIAALDAVVRAYRQLGFRRLVYKPVPRIFHVLPAEDDLYALFRLGACRSGCALAVAIDLQHRARPSLSLTRARKLGVAVCWDPDRLDPFWEVLVRNLDERHGVIPTHTIDEMQELMRRFPDQIRLVTGLLGGNVVAGAVLFFSRRAVHTQYLASDSAGRTAGALEVVLEDCIERARDEGPSFFSFGISTEHQGLVLNDGLHRFKTKFGGGGIVHETYTLDL